MLLTAFLIGGTPTSTLGEWDSTDLGGNLPFLAEATVSAGYQDVSSIENWDKYGTLTTLTYDEVWLEIEALVVAAGAFANLTAADKIVASRLYMADQSDRDTVHTMAQQEAFGKRLLQNLGQNKTDLDIASDGVDLAALTVTDIEHLVTQFSTSTTDFYGRNETGSAIAKGTPVFVSGLASDGVTPLISEANASSPTTMPCGGITTQLIPNNQTRLVKTSGIITIIDTSTFNDNDTLYVNDGGGGLTNDDNNATNVQAVAIVKIVNNPNGQILVALNALSSHQHDATDVISGTFADARISASSVAQHVMRPTFCIWAEENSGVSVSSNNYEYSFGNGATNSTSDPPGIPMGVNCTLIGIGVSSRGTSAGTNSISISVTKNGSVVGTSAIESSVGTNIKVNGHTDITPDTVTFAPGDTMQFLTASAVGSHDDVKVVAWFERTS